MRVVLLGPPGCGKGTQAQKLSRHLGVRHISTGELFRHNINAGTELGLRAKLCELAKSTPGHLLAAFQTVQNSTESERAHWTFGDTVTLRGDGEPTTLALPF